MKQFLKIMIGVMVLGGSSEGFASRSYFGHFRHLGAFRTATLAGLGITIGTTVANKNFSLSQADSSTAEKYTIKTTAIEPSVQGGLMALRGRGIAAAFASNKIDPTIDPAKALDHANAVREKFWEEYNDFDIDFENKNIDLDVLLARINKSVASYEKESEHFLQGECKNLDGGDCPLSRKYAPNAREEFTKQLVQRVLEIAKEKRDESVGYVSFGSGGRYFDLVTLDSALKANSSLKIDAHLIDKSYCPYVDIKECIDEKDMKVQSDGNLAFTPEQKQKAIQWARKMDPTGSKDLTDEITWQYLMLDMHVRHIGFQQFSRYFAKKYPAASVKQHVHGSTDRYLAYLKKTKKEHADLTVACDIDDEGSRYAHSIDHYRRLCMETMDQKKNAQNLMLGITMYGAPVLREIVRDDGKDEQ